MTTKKPTHTPGPLSINHSRECDPSCGAGEDGIIFGQELAPGQTHGIPAGKWIAYYAHDERPCPDDPEQWQGVWFQVLAEAETEAEVRAAIAKAEGK